MGARSSGGFVNTILIPTLLSAVADHANPNTEVLGSTLIELVESLYAELAGPRDGRLRRATPS